MKFLVVKRMSREVAEQWEGEFIRSGYEVQILSYLEHVKGQLIGESDVLVVDLMTIKSDHKFFVDVLREHTVTNLLIITDIYPENCLENWVIQIRPSISETVEAIIRAKNTCLSLGKSDWEFEFIETILKLCKAYSEELLSDKQELSVFAQAIPIVLYRGGKDWTAKFFGPRIEEITGYSIDDFERGRITWKDLILSEDFSRVKQAVIDALRSNLTYEREYRIKTAAGDLRWIKDVGTIVLDDEKRELLFYGAALDVTEEKQLLQQIEFVRRKWEETFNSISNMVLVLNSDFVITRANKAFVDRIGLNLQNIIGKKCWEVNCKKPEYADECPCKVRIKNGDTIQEEIYSEVLGGYFFRILTPIRNKDGEFIGAVFVYTDITPLKKAEKELLLLNNELNTVIDSVSAIVISVNCNGIISRWNNVAQEVFGVSPENAVGKKLQQIGVWQGMENILSEAMATINDGVKRCIEEVKVKLSDEKEIFLNVIIQPLKKGKGDGYRILIIAFDITEKKYMEMNLLHAQKLRSLGMLAAGIAHEINTPAQCLSTNLPFISGVVQRMIALIDKYEDLEREVLSATGDRESREKLSIIIDEINAMKNREDFNFLRSEVPVALKESSECLGHITRIVSSVKTFSYRGSSESKRAININKILEDMANMTRSIWKRVAEVNVQTDDSLPPVFCIPGEINQVFLNIFMNAIDAIKDKIKVNPNFKGVVSIKSKRNDPWCEVSICDNGVGIPDEIKGRIFEPFFTTKDPGVGTGQGLAIAQAIVVQKHQGQLFFESRVNEGTVFIVRLPLEDTFVHGS